MNLVETYVPTDVRTNAASPRVDSPGGSTENLVMEVAETIFVWYVLGGGGG